LTDAVLLWGGGRLFLVRPAERAVEAVGPPSVVPPPPGSFPTATLRAALVRLGPGARVRSAQPAVHELLAEAGLPDQPASLMDLRTARELLPARPFEADRAGILEEARRRLTEALASPEETLIALAREEERVERALAREAGAADQWVSGDAGPLSDYARDWEGLRAALEAHHRRLEAQLDAAARACVPNLSALLGGRVAGRLVAAAGGLPPLARMDASRLQMLGTRRRPGGNRGPKYGTIARAVHAIDLPLGRHGAFARSLAALSAIAVRADATTHSDLARILLARRDKRVERLRKAGVR
jgi:hypothetical protein